MILDKLHPILRRFRAPAGENGSDDGGTGAEDRGDDFTPTEDDAPEVKKPEAKKPEAKAAAKDDGEDDPDAADKDQKKPEAKKADGEAVDDDEDKDGKEDKAGADKRKDTRIPVSRHKEILAKERERADELQKKLAAYEGGDRIAVINEDIKKSQDKVLELDTQYAKLITDGEHAKAAEVMRQIRALESEIAEAKGDLKAQAASARAVEKMRYDIAVERLEAAYPVLDPEHDDHDPDRAQDVVDLAATYRARGLTPAEAIQKAAKTLLGVATKKQEAAATVKPRVDKDEAEEAARREAKEAERKKTQVEKNVDATKKQPPDTSRVGADSDKAGGSLSAKDIMKMSQEDFAKLDEDTLARMRGDVIA